MRLPLNIPGEIKMMSQQVAQRTQRNQRQTINEVSEQKSLKIPTKGCFDVLDGCPFEFHGLYPRLM